MEVVRAISKVGVDSKDRPKIPVAIIDSGQIDDPRFYLKYDPFQDSVLNELAEHKRILNEEMKKSEGENIPHITDILNKEVEDYVKKVEESEKKEETQRKIVSITRSNETPLNLSAKRMDKLNELRMKRNEALKKNREASESEEHIANDKDFTRNQKIETFKKKSEKSKEDLAFKGIDPEKPWLNLSANELERLNGRKRKSKETFGWEVFNEDTLYKAYKKRCNDLSFYKEDYEKQMEGENGEHIPSENQVESLVDYLQKQLKFLLREEKKKKFSRRRIFVDDHNINYINERNRIYNTKLERHYAAFTAEIRNNLERGTAQ